MFKTERSEKRMANSAKTPLSFRHLPSSEGRKTWIYIYIKRKRTRLLHPSFYYSISIAQISALVQFLRLVPRFHHCLHNSGRGHARSFSDFGSCFFNILFGNFAFFEQSINVWQQFFAQSVFICPGQFANNLATIFYGEFYVITIERNY